MRARRVWFYWKNIPHAYLITPPREASSEVVQVNPLGRIPALILDDDTCIFDSSVIADYADTLNDTPILIPRHSAAARMRVKRWEALADGIVDSAVVVRTESLRPGDKQDADTIIRHNQAITRALAYAADQLAQQSWCEGTALTLGDLALVSALIYLDLRQTERHWRALHPNLAVWFSNISGRASVRTTLAV
ncbi:MAG: glutathione S-transferase N-terminal domain-containing protein [Gallionellaceae bacterium]|nr:glutathione S-transferase N-terminal domain-containing protein [Gallionellaceae bacterium]